MIRALVSDFSRVLLFPADDLYSGGLNALHQKLAAHGDYNFWEHFRLNRDLLAFYKTLGERVGIYMFTTEHIQEHPALQSELDGTFKGIFSGARLGLMKTDANTYEVIAEKIGLPPQEVLYVDDQQRNLDAANRVGMVTVRYVSNRQLQQDVLEVLGGVQLDT